MLSCREHDLRPGKTLALGVGLRVVWPALAFWEGDVGDFRANPGEPGAEPLAAARPYSHFLRLKMTSSTATMTTQSTIMAG